MKQILIILCLLWGTVQAQTIGYLRYDTVKMAKNGGTTELVLENATKAVTGGVLTNTGNGRTAFVTPSGGTVVSDSAWMLTGNSGTNPATDFLGTTDAQPLIIKTNNTEQLIFEANGDWTLPKTTTIYGDGNQLEFNGEGGDFVVQGVQAASIQDQLESAIIIQNGVSLSQSNAGGFGAHPFSELIVKMDSITLRPNAGELRIDTLNYSDAADDSMMVWSNANGGHVGMRAIPSGGGTPSLTQYRLAIGDASNLLSTNASITGDRLLLSDPNGVPVASSVTNTEAGYLSGVTSAIQTQIDGKWSTLGNSGLASGTYFLGKTDNTSLFFRTNNTNKIKLDSNGNVQIGSLNSTMSSTGSLLVGNGGTGFGFQSLYVGSTNVGSSSKAYQVILGSTNTVSSDRGFAHGLSNTTSGANAAAFGGTNFARADYEFSIGYFCTDYTPAVGLTDRAFNVGASQDAGSTKADAFTILKNGQVGIGIRTAKFAPHASVILDVASTTQGFAPPRMTAAQASAISSPIDGLMLYVTDTDGTFTAVGFWGREAGTWIKL